MNNNPIGILDSGVGGLSVWKEVATIMPGESFVYVGDSKNAPYGPREPEEILLLAKRLIEFLLEHKVKLIIIACNTITVSGIDNLRQEFPGIPIIGTVPVIKTAAQITKSKKIGVFSTTRTAKSQDQRELIQKYAQGCEVFTVGSDELVPLIEKGIVAGREVRKILQKELLPLQERNIDTLAIACTHYPFIEKEIRAVIGSDVQILEPSAAIARHAERILEQNRTLTTDNKRSYTFYTTGDKNILKHLLLRLNNIPLQSKVESITL
jgi:glutamate racemase